MIRRVFKKQTKSHTIDKFIKKYKIPREYLSINRKSMAKAAFIGLFVAMIPMPFQMLAVLLFIPLIKYNVPFALSLVWITNPFTMPIIYYIEYYTGSLLLFSPGVGDLEMSVQWFQDNLSTIFFPLYVGALFYATIVGSLSYYLITHLWLTSVRQAHKLRKHKRNKK